MKFRYVLVLSGVLACGTAAADVGDRVEDRLDQRGSLAPSQPALQQVQTGGLEGDRQVGGEGVEGTSRM